MGRDRTGMCQRHKTLGREGLHSLLSPTESSLMKSSGPIANLAYWVICTGFAGAKRRCDGSAGSLHACAHLHVSVYVRKERLCRG